MSFFIGFRTVRPVIGMHFKGGEHQRQRQRKCNTRYQIAVAANDDDDNGLFVTIKTTLPTNTPPMRAIFLLRGAKKLFKSFAFYIPKKTA